jgi:hypothetical protein
MQAPVTMDTIKRAVELYHEADSFVACLSAISGEFTDPHQVMAAQLMAIFLENRDAFEEMAPKTMDDGGCGNDIYARTQRAMKYLKLLRDRAAPSTKGTAS